MIIPELPPQLQRILIAIVALVIGYFAGFNHAMTKVEADQAKNDLEIIIHDQRAVKKEEKITNKILNNIRKENEQDKPFECSDAKLPDQRVLRLEREIDNARRRSNGSLLDRAIDKARNLR